jgi:hypothetical protein
MCCLFTTLVFLGPRFGILVWWLLDPFRFQATFGDNWVLILLTWLFLPWTLLMYVVVAPFGAQTAGPDIQGFDWILLILAFITDIFSYAGGAYGNRNTVYSYVPAAAMGSDYPYTPPTSPYYPPPPPPPPAAPPSDTSSSSTST